MTGEYYSVIFKLDMLSRTKYYVKHCQSKEEYLNFIDYLYKKKMYKIGTIADKERHWDELDSLIEKITHGKINESSLIKELDLIREKIRKRQEKQIKIK